MQKNWLKRAFGYTVSALKRVWRWIKRALFGGGKELLSLDKEGLETPAKRLRAVFFAKKGAVAALVILAALTLFTFIAPAFVRLDVNYTDPLQQNLAPSYSLRAVPRKLKKGVAFIDGFSGFTIGVDTNGKLYIWGESKDRLTKTNLKKIPEVVQKEGVAFVAAGKDHILALTKTGKIVGWGDNSRGQYGTQAVLNALPMPTELVGGVNPDEVASLSCGYQASALILKSGKCYVWGNINAVKNLADFQNAERIEKLLFTGSAAVALTKEGEISTGKEDIFHAAISAKNGRQNDFNAYMVGRKVREIATDNKCIALLCDDGELVVAGAFENGEDILPRLKDEERFVSLDGGTRHFVGITDEGRVYAWGHNAYGQCTLKKGKCTSAFAGAMQTYTVDNAGKLQESVGLKGYLFGTDGRGRDVFARIIHGGKMTLTIGGVAVIVSSVIAILVGCVAGYFGGAVDTLLMRVTEIFSSMPFLPFAMLLSQIIKNYNIGETARIFIIMLILGALSWTGLARMIRGQVLSEREKEFVLAARAMGISEGKIAFRHVLPNVLSVILVSMTLDFASCLLTESSLSYLGFGVQPPRPTWGNMLSGSNNSMVIQNYWWQWLFPALFLSLAVICINVIGDALRDCFDTKRE